MNLKIGLKNYNIQYFVSYNTSCLNYFSKSIYLKVITLGNFSGYEAKDMEIFLQLKCLHSLRTFFKNKLK